MKISSGIWRPFCLGLNVLNVNEYLLQHAYKEFIERHCSYWAHNVILIHQEADPSHECFKIRLSMLYPEIHLWLNYKLNRQLAEGIDVWLHPIIFYTSNFNVPRCRARRFMTTQKTEGNAYFYKKHFVPPPPPPTTTTTTTTQDPSPPPPPTPTPLPIKACTTLVPKFEKHPFFADFGWKKHPFWSKTRFFRNVS